MIHSFSTSRYIFDGPFPGWNNPFWLEKWLEFGIARRYGPTHNGLGPRECRRRGTMNHARYRLVAEQLDTINGPGDGNTISEALARIVFAALPDWGDFVVPGWCWWTGFARFSRAC